MFHGYQLFFSVTHDIPNSLIVPSCSKLSTLSFSHPPKRFPALFLGHPRCSQLSLILPSCSQLQIYLYYIPKMFTAIKNISLIFLRCSQLSNLSLVSSQDVHSYQLSPSPPTKILKLSSISNLSTQDISSYQRSLSHSPKMLIINQIFYSIFPRISTLSHHSQMFLASY